MQGSGFRVQGSGLRVQGLGCRIQGSGIRVQVLGLGDQGSGFRVQSSGFRVYYSSFRVEGSGFRVQGLGLRDQGFGSYVDRGTAVLPLEDRGPVLPAEPAPREREILIDNLLVRVHFIIEMSRPALRHESLNPLFQVALYLPS